jgi:integrase
MELSIQTFLDSVSNPNTKKEYRHGIKKFCEWYGKSVEEILQLRKEDLTQINEEGLVEYRNRAARFEREIEKFHSSLLDKGFMINTARNLTLGIRQLFRYYEMGIRFRAGSKIAKTVKTTKNFPLTIEHIRTMFKVADLRERVILNMATDLGLRIGDFIAIKKSDLPPLDQEPPISFDLMTDKEDVIAHGFISQESVDLLKAYLPTLEKKNDNRYLFPSNSESHISDEWMNRLLQRLAEKAQIDLNGKDFTFHCFRKMFLSAAIDSGVGLTAGKKLCGKAIAESDDTYLTTINLKTKFQQLKNFLTINKQPKHEDEEIDSLRQAVSKLQEDLTTQKTVTDAVARENSEMRKQLEQLKPLIEFTNTYDTPEELKTILEFLAEDSSSEDKLKPLETQFSQFIRAKLDEMMKKKGISEKEAIQQLITEDLAEMKKAERNFKKVEKRVRARTRRPQESANHP